MTLDRDVVPPLTDGVLTLRAHRDDDVPSIVEQCTDPAMIAFVPIPRPYGPEQAREYLQVVRDGWREGSRLSWAIDVPDVATGGARFGGSIDYRPRGDGVAEIGFGLHPAARGHGYAARAARLVLDHAFAHGVRLVVWRAVVGNWASRRTAWACGFRLEGSQRGALAHPDGPQDAWIATLAAGDPRAPVGAWHVPPVLHAGRGLRLRPWRDDDVLPPTRDAETQAFLGPVAPTAEEYPGWLQGVREDMAAGCSMRWAIVDAARDVAAAEDGRADGAPPTPVLGGVHVFGLGNPRRPGGRVGYWLRPQVRGRGIAVAALRAVVDHAFAPVVTGGLGLSRLGADADVAHPASVGVLRAAGFTPCGVHERETAVESPGHGDMLECQIMPPGMRLIRRPRWRLLRLPALTDGVVGLSPFTEADLPTMAELLREPDGWPEGSPDAGTDDAAAWLRRLRGDHSAGRAATWAIRIGDGDRSENGAGTPVGTVRAARLDDPFSTDGADLGYWVRSSRRRAGVATRASRLLTDHLLAASESGGAGLRRVTAMTSPENVASQAVLTACGFARWGVEPHAVPPGSLGAQRSPFQGDMPSADRWRYERVVPGP